MTTHLEVFREYADGDIGERPLAHGETIVFDQLPSPHERVRTALEARVVGQQAIIGAIIDTLDASDLRDETDRPLGSFASIGPLVWVKPHQPML